MNESEQYFNLGVAYGEAVFHEHLKGCSLMASLYNDSHAIISLRKLQVRFGIILPHQDMIKRGIIMGVKVAGSKQRRVNHG